MSADHLGRLTLTERPPIITEIPPIYWKTRYFLPKDLNFAERPYIANVSHYFYWIRPPIFTERPPTLEVLLLNPILSLHSLVPKDSYFWSRCLLPHIPVTYSRPPRANQFGMNFGANEKILDRTAVVVYLFVCWVGCLFGCWFFLLVCFLLVVFVCLGKVLLLWQIKVKCHQTWPVDLLTHASYRVFMVKGQRS